MAFAAERGTSEGYVKLFPCRTGAYRVTTTGSTYAKVNQDGFRNTVSINVLAKVPVEGKLNDDVTSKSRSNMDINTAKEVSTAKEKSSDAVEKFVGHENRPTGAYHTVRWYGYEPRTALTGLLSVLPIIPGRNTAGDYESKGTSLQGGKEEQREKGYI